MTTVNQFGDWWAKHPQLHPYTIPIKGSSKWARIYCSYERALDKDQQNGFQKLQGEIEKTICAAVICLSDKSRYAGNIYDNSSYLELWCKFSALAMIVRPVHAIASIAYHILGIGLVRTVIKDVKHKASIKTIASKALQSLAEIHKVPYYEALLEGAALVGMVGGIFKKDLLYECRAFTDLTMRKMYKGHTKWSGSPCMYRIVNITFFEKREQQIHKEIVYPNLHDSILVGLVNVAASL
ncbi:hypothetical protein PHSC3_001500 [Chlamydiales bacterium STE3]|nr:hypothetical protein PHSC3_001500 [Chlamydiales bacterium STE3]